MCSIYSVVCTFSFQKGAKHVTNKAIKQSVGPSPSLTSFGPVRALRPGPGDTHGSYIAYNSDIARPSTVRDTLAWANSQPAPSSRLYLPNIPTYTWTRISYSYEATLIFLRRLRLVCDCIALRRVNSGRVACGRERCSFEAR